jgi:NAD(P)-dependent dehydrogenase (short-subunit alcohol dehydrogenase family)
VPPTPLSDVPVEAYDSAIAISLRSIFLSMKFETPAMLRTGQGGSIVNMASIAGLSSRERGCPIDDGMLAGVPSFNVSSDKKLFGRDTR